MKIVLATSNKDKVKEIKEFLKDYEIYALSEIMQPFEIVESGSTFKENALIKSNAVYDKLKELGLDDEFVALSDDSGICVDVLGGRPGIYSARFSGENATDKSNRTKLIQELNGLNITTAQAHYVACIAISSKFGEFCTHGFMYGDVINEERGDNGFGYDFMFVPNGFDKTVGELDYQTKLEISHRSKGLELAKIVLKTLQKKFAR
ncbi:putative dITP/XTP pyrophosphatase [Campylobacter pinnipediorum subsp. caledonicus]|uniref:dITP/XTP pyrophosphatase n=1 Tax=Campylobacter pinnipediorum subsp. caledonicus TaxID=1874362 RepID=A0A1S6U9C4_9BACT|nr:RdgB/HAM1 family non-canonical purine NTP pyrophosphatase [Campylobacter pinnipediorum]AQW88333.1 putative dITP/XTP pyrophosphatase [Campylobacter pinnipediorum subsp. caledonicus]OPA70955.1 non-canonical purine NTP pyrophosphatase, RdgB/HAM1 family [Campylobacter pinnipediorum subsp. caledonicus]